MHSGRLNHLQGIFKKTIQSTSSQIHLDIFNEEHSLILEKLNEYHTLVTKKSILSEGDVQSSVDMLNKLFNDVYNDLESAVSPEAKKEAVEKFKIWSYASIGLLVPLSIHKQFESSFMITTLVHKKLKYLINYITNYNESDKHIFNELYNILQNKRVDALSTLGDCYLYKHNPPAATRYFSEAVDLTDEFIPNDEWRIFVKANILLKLSECHSQVGDIDESYLYLYQANCIIRLKKDDFFFNDRYIPALEKYFTALIASTSFTEAIFKNSLKLIPGKEYSKEFYLRFYGKLISELLKKKHYNLASQLIPFLTDCTITELKKHGEACLQFIKNKNWEKVKSWHKTCHAVSTKTVVCLQEDKKTVQIRLLNVPPTTKLKNFSCQGLTYKITRNNSNEFIINLPELTTVESIQKLLEEIENRSFTNLTSTDTMPTNNKSESAVDAIGSNSKEEIVSNADITAQDLSSKKTKKRQSNSSAISESKMEITHAETQLSQAEKLGFKSSFKDKIIYPISSPILPNGTYFGFYSRENTDEKKTPEEIHQKCEAILQRGKVHYRSPCIKYIKTMADTFKLAPLADFRMFSRVVDQTYVDGKKRKLLAFDQPHDHQSQKAIYKVITK